MDSQTKTVPLDHAELEAVNGGGGNFMPLPKPPRRTASETAGGTSHMTDQNSGLTRFWNLFK